MSANSIQLASVRATPAPALLPRTLITGASGFVGGHVASHLVRLGYPVRGLIRNTARTSHLNDLSVETVRGDVLDRDALRQAVANVETVVHLAGRTCAASYRQLLEVNEMGTRNLLAAAAACQSPPTVVLVSSLAAAGPTPHGTVRTERDPVRPISLYGRSKLAGELAAREFADRVPITIVRPAVVFGPRDVGIHNMLKPIRDWAVHPIVGRQPPVLSLIHAADLAELLGRAAQRGRRLPAAGRDAADADLGDGVYFAAHPHRLDLVQLGQMWHELLQVRRPLTIVHLPRPVASLAALANETVAWLRGRSDLFNRDKIREAAVESWACSCAAARDQLGFIAHESLREQFRVTIDWYFANGWLK